MIDYDIRSRYSGEAATGTITDSLSVAATGQGEKVILGGPASPIGMAVATCVRQAVKEAATKQDGQRLGRPITKRLKERRLPIEKIAQELSKIESLSLDAKSIVAKLEKTLESNPMSAMFLLAALKLDEESQKKLIPPTFGSADSLSVQFGCLISTRKGSSVKQTNTETVNLPRFTKQALINILQN
jgi:hypothetical protein